MKVTIVVFANSVKNQGHCVAGKDISTQRWLRLVSDEYGSALSYGQCLCSNPYGKFPVKPLQKIEIEFVKSASLIHQPDNYLIANVIWQQKYKITEEEIVNYLDNPQNLWGSGDRIYYDLIESGAIHIEQSLYLVKVNDLRLYRNEYQKRRASFNYQNVRYDFAVTDPDFDTLLQNDANLQEILCISLGQKWQSSETDRGSCYKIVAAIF